MEKNFWKKLKKPIIVQAPMSGITDQAFRLMLLKHGKPDVFWAEFVSVEGLFSRGKDYCLEILKYSVKEKPIVAQIFGNNPEYFQKAAKLVSGVGFDGVDINMGCPDRAIEKQGAGSALIKDFQLAKEIIRATKIGAGKIPVSVKTRIGYNENEISSWIKAILEENIAVLTVHFRTRNELYSLPANWELAKEVLKFRDKISPNTLIFGNGDIKNIEQAKKTIKETGLDGIMIGRGLLGNPWFFANKIPNKKERIFAVLEHMDFFKKTKPNGHFDSLKKHFHAYIKDFYGAKNLRDNLMKTKNFKEAQKICRNALSE